MAKSFGLFVLGRATFDVEYARACAARAVEVLRGEGCELAGTGRILFDNAEVVAALDDVAERHLDGIIVVQSTFTDAEAVCLIAERLNLPLHIWAIPEPRTGGRLRLNAFCGLNLAAHALALRKRPFVSLYAAPDSPGIETEVAGWLARTPDAPLPLRAAGAAVSDAGSRGLDALRGARIGRIGTHPAGFDTCAYEPKRLSKLCDAHVESVELEDLFAAAAKVPDGTVNTLLEECSSLSGIGELDQDELVRSLRLKGALDDLKAGGRFDGFAIRCWPETFTEYGGAVCGPVGMMGEKRTPCACEADVYGAVTSLMLQALSGGPAFLADVVDIDDETDTGVVWHCGQAPVSMADPATPLEATVHSNRRMPLLFQFALKPGRVTLARISQARGEQSMVMATGDMLAAPPSFSGTSGVVRFDAPAKTVLERLLASGLEHHLALVYGEHRDALEHVARELDLPVLDLTQ
ncbi:hypothetical protein [uncultured Nitratireductor sp.]|uniref:L-fucose/L-arabinose isomerase family protein n=1 Tax=uncultured Nitratireductor sp. TaxID=520953 RepID=UPI0025FAACF8|nr:hypothetical protein [uncultured Nitratireductor sp.]